MSRVVHWHPLETEEDEGQEARTSDHRVAYAKIKLTRIDKFRWESYSYRRYTDQAADKFREWITWHDWDTVLSAESSDAKAEAYQETVTSAVERFFPLRKVKKRSTDPPWMDKRTRDLIEERKRLYREEGEGGWRPGKKRRRRRMRL